MTTFEGFPAEALEFLEELEQRNEREWFKANRERYDAHLATPAAALGEELSDLGRPKLFRPWNDTRYHLRPPIKEHVGLAIGYEGSGGYYVELSLDGLLVAAGLHSPRPDQVERMRQAIDRPATAAALTRAVRRAESAGLDLSEPDLVRGPRGYPADHPRMELLRRRRLVVSKREPVGSWLASPAAGDRIRESLEAATPLVRWLRRHIGPSATGA